MPILRWLGARGVTSLPSTRILPEVGRSKPATMRKIVVCTTEGPASEMKFAAIEVEVGALHHRVGAEGF